MVSCAFAHCGYVVMRGAAVECIADVVCSGRKERMASLPRSLRRLLVLHT